MKALVTGAAGFVGSTLADSLLGDGWGVRGVDSFSSYYDPALKRANLSSASRDQRFELVVADLVSADLDDLLDGIDVVFHQAGQPGVRMSWADDFRVYADANIVATQRLLEATTRRSGTRLVYASSSSVYGNATVAPTHESHPTRPFSPYGVTKLAGELLCSAYSSNFGVHCTVLRYFTVYGPRQRPDMATHRLVEAALSGTSFPLFGDGRQVRDFTFVDDIVRANALAATADTPPGTTCNLAGGSSVELVDLVALVEATTRRPIEIAWQPAQAGDVRRTGGAIDEARRLLGWEPQIDLTTGVRRQVDWHTARSAGRS